MGSDPRDSSLTPTDVKSVAVPGRRGEVASDAKITARIARPASDDTPPPLPPSPAAESAARWLARTQTGLPDVTPRPPPRPEPPPHRPHRPARPRSSALPAPPRARPGPAAAP